MKNLIVLNPSSGRGKTLSLREKIEAELKQNDIDFTLYVSKSADDIIGYTRAKVDEYDNFISVGGDGTLHYILNGIAKADKTIGVIPTGSGNDISINLGLPLDISESIKAIKQANTKKIDIGLIDGKDYYLCIAGAGFDSVVNDLANNTRFPIKGPAIYSYSVYKTLITFRSKKFLISYDGSSQSVDSMMMTASNMKSYGGGMRITPHASFNDGLLDICIIKRMNKIHFVKTFPKVYDGKHLSDPFVESFRTDKIKIECEYNFSVFADGEYICKLPATFEVLPKRQKIIVPLGDD